MALFITDVTESRRFEDEMYRKEQRLRALLEHSPDIILRVDRDGKVLYISRPRYGSTHTIEDILGTRVFDWVPEAFHERWTQALRRAFEERKPDSFEVKTKDGYHWLSRLAPLSQEQPPTSALLISTDITAQREVSRRLEDALARLQQLDDIVTRSPAVAFRLAVTDDWPVHFVSENVRQFGYDPEDFVERRLSYADLIPGEDLERLQHEVAAHVEEGHTEFQQNYRLRMASGELRWMEDWNHLHYDDGLPTHMSGIVLDVTERKEAQEALEKSRGELRQLAARLEVIREEERTVIAREIHDELGHELTILKMDLAWVRKRLNDETVALPRDALLERIEATIAATENTIQSVRRIASDLRPPVLDLGIVAAIEWEGENFERHTGIRCLIRAAAVEATLTPERETVVFRVFQEILTNVARHAEASEVDVCFDVIPDGLSFQVKDNGKGISDDDLNRTTSLGLLSMRERVEAINGTFSITGQCGQGTTVTVELALE
ncbi:MAG: PAS domain S-box protein [Lentisphaerae bacterium]|nr:PAS domain S-box protein [Lentisphaerota bacterium]